LPRQSGRTLPDLPPKRMCTAMVDATYTTRWAETIPTAMGLTDVKMRVSNPGLPKKSTTVSLLVDSGATYSVLPREVCRKLGLKAQEELEFSLADGRPVVRGVAEARFEFAGRVRTSPVLLGEPGDVALLGVVTLETLGLVLNPLRRELVPIRALVAGVR